MNNEKYKYDIAFSFLAEDEQLAVVLNDLLSTTCSTFLYSKKQDEIAGTDGEKTFNKVFGEDARIVAVLFRDTWGETPWTRIEETAIRNRAFEEGYDFVVFIPLENNPKLPEWLPKPQIWIGIDRWGPKGAASVIEARVQQEGGEPKEESVQGQAARIKRKKDADVKRKKFLDSHEGVWIAQEEIKRVLLKIEKNTI